MQQVVIIDGDFEALTKLRAFCTENNIAFNSDPSAIDVEEAQWESSDEDWNSSGC